MPFTMIFWAFVPILIAIFLFFFLSHSGGKSGVSKKTDGVKVRRKSHLHSLFSLQCVIGFLIKYKYKKQLFRTTLKMGELVINMIGV